MYFVDWPALNRHKAAFVQRIDLFVDGQDPTRPQLIQGDDARATFERLTHTVFRPRPWFEPGAWGGQWLKETMSGLAQDVPNYAWSFEMIAPEQGIILEHEGRLLELSYDWLQYYDNRAVLGDYAAYFGYEFPIRFDFLDTIAGGNLSLQCHPRPAFIREQFGEHFTQDETYYIFAADDDACVYLGFRAGTDGKAFRGALEDSLRQGSALDVERFVQRHPARMLAISSSSRMAPCTRPAPARWCWRSAPRPISSLSKSTIGCGSVWTARRGRSTSERAFANLDFSLAGEAVDALLSQPVVSSTIARSAVLNSCRPTPGISTTFSA